MENQEKYPQNKKPFTVGKAGSTENRKKAMEKSALPTKKGFHRDEKPPNFVNHDGKSVTVKHLPAKESSKHLSSTEDGFTQIKYSR